MRSCNRPDIVSVCCFRCLLTSMWHYEITLGNTPSKDGVRFPPNHKAGELPRFLIGGGRFTWPCLEYATRAHFDYLSGSLSGTVGRSQKGTCLGFLSLWKSVCRVGASTRCLRLFCPNSSEQLLTLAARLHHFELTCLQFTFFPLFPSAGLNPALHIITVRFSWREFVHAVLQTV